ncbi:MAG: hypothetical protein GY745_00150 [Actinomycetia bacterium]|nr:hypothetical protein [Actinomycetes bacterium]
MRTFPSRGDDRGTVTIAGLGCCLALLLLGGVAIDLWRVLADRRELAGVAEAAALSAVDAIDPEQVRQTGEVVLEPADASRRAWQVVLDRADELMLSGPPVVAVTDQEVTVGLTATVELGVIRILLGPSEIEISVESTARPLVLD